MIGFPEAPRYAALVKALTGDEELVPPGIILESDRPEYSFLKKEGLWFASFPFAAVAANYNQFALFSPSPARDPSRLSVILAIVSTVAANAGLISAFVGATAQPAYVAWRDRRNIGSPNTKAFTKQTVAVSLFAVLPFIPIPANVWVYPDAFIIGGAQVGQGGPGIFALESDVVNVNQKLGIIGYERFLRPEETAET